MIFHDEFFSKRWQNFCEIWHKITFMKKNSSLSPFAYCCFIWSCNNSGDTTSNGDTTSTASSGDTAGNMATNTKLLYRNIYS
jgi:hypothetical protein